MSNPTDPTISSSSPEEFTTIAIDSNDYDEDAGVNPVQTHKEKTSSNNRFLRGTKNAWRRAVGCCKKSTPRTKIHLKEHQIVKRKKAFGMKYIDLLRSKDATEEQLEQVIQACMQDIDLLVSEITELENKIEQVSEETKSKLTDGTTTSKPTKPIYPNSGLYVGSGDPVLDDEEHKAPPERTFSITDDDDDSHPEKEAWMPSPPSTPPPPVPAA